MQPAKCTVLLASLSITGEFEMNKRGCEPTLSDLLSDPILDVLLACDRVSREDLARMIEEARQTLACVPREWHVGGRKESERPRVSREVQNHKDDADDQCQTPRPAHHEFGPCDSPLCGPPGA